MNSVTDAPILCFSNIYFKIYLVMYIYVFHGDFYLQVFLSKPLYAFSLYPRVLHVS
jgi:hypothetical protein